MRRTDRLGVIRSVLAVAAIFGLGGGCALVYSFDRDPPIACTKTEECPGSDQCGQRQCNKGICVIENPAAVGALTINNLPGNCLRFVCDGRGNEIIEKDDKNVRSDGNACTDDICKDGKPISVMTPAGTQCGAIPTVTCSDMGVCQGCMASADCGEDTDCYSWSCENTICVKKLQPVGKEVANPVSGDCKKNLCNAIGESPEAFAADDAPSDEDPCTADYCSATGEILHDPLPESTKCGDCSACAVDGSCKPCDPATSACLEGSCVPKPKMCTTNDECTSKYCVDGYCCNTECSSPCMACDETKTGVLSGNCAPIKDGTDPDAECSTKNATDTCRAASCGCANGVKDGNESGVDCGGACATCTGKWNCGGLSTCGGAGAGQYCCYFCSCPNDSASCQSVEGQTCALGSPDLTYQLGTVYDSNCAAGFFPACRSVTCRCQ